jgi:hypothetical protein
MRIAAERIPSMLSAFPIPPVNNTGIFADDSPPALNQATSRGLIAAVHQTDEFPEGKTVHRTKTMKKSPCERASGRVRRVVEAQDQTPEASGNPRCPVPGTQLTRTGSNRKKDSSQRLTACISFYFFGFYQTISSSSPCQRLLKTYQKYKPIHKRPCRGRMLVV